MDAPAPHHDAAGRPRRGLALAGLVLAGLVVAVGVPATGYTWLSERNVDRDAAQLAEDVRIAARLVDDLETLRTGDATSLPDSGLPSELAEALGHPDELAGATIGADGISAVYEVRWGLATRCVHLLVRPREVRTDVTDSNRCEPRTL